MEIQATISWTNEGSEFDSRRYRRAHTWSFDGGAEVPASSSPDIVPVPMSDASAVDPEEAYVASLSSCHMLWFLSIVAQAGFKPLSYKDEATGEMRKNEQGKLTIDVVTLRPAVTWASEHAPTGEEVAQMHHRAHEECFIANSVHTEIRIEI